MASIQETKNTYRKTIKYFLLILIIYIYIIYIYTKQWYQDISNIADHSAKCYKDEPRALYRKGQITQHTYFMYDTQKPNQNEETARA